MQIIVNGKRSEIQESISILEYLKRKKINPFLVRLYLTTYEIQPFLNLGKHEVELYDYAVTDWERDRYLEMI